MRGSFLRMLFWLLNRFQNRLLRFFYLFIRSESRCVIGELFSTLVIFCEVVIERHRFDLWQLSFELNSVNLSK